MTFATDTLSFKAYTYKSNRTPISISTETIQLVPRAGGQYGVDKDNILVKVHSAALNPVDLVFYNSAYPLLSHFLLPQGIGKDYSGTVVDIGENASAKSGLKKGDEVFGLYPHVFAKGTVSEYIILNAFSSTDSTIAKKPSKLNFNEAAAVPLVYGTADLMMKNHVLSGKKVLVLGGATSVGRYVIQLAKIGGAREIVTTNSSKSSEIVSKLGSNKQIDYTAQKSILDPVLNSVKESGEFDYIYDTCGSSDLFGEIKHILKPKSTGSAYVTCVGDVKYSYDNVHFLGVVRPIGCSVIRTISSLLGLSGINYSVIALAAGKEWIERAKKLIEEDKLHIFVDSVYQFDEFDKAYARIQSNRANGKVVIQVESN